VLVWIHGGGFLIGSGTTPVYYGGDLAKRGDVVVVTINYRLGALGYAHLGTVLGPEFAQSTNLGVRDQIAALEWVQGNIARFGGDPGNVTVFGQSAGGMSIGALLGAPRARALMHRAICQSGAADHVVSTARAREVASAFLRELGGPSPSHAALGRIPLAEILRAQMAVMARHSDLRQLMAFLPAVDGDVIPDPPLDQLRRGAAAKIPILTGATLEEWKLFGVADGMGFDETDLVARFAEVLPAYPDAPRPKEAVRAFRGALGERSAAERPRWVWQALQTARVFHVPSAHLAEAQRAGGGSAHSYLVTWRAAAARRALGACHAIEIPFVFGNTTHPIARPLTGLRADAERLSRQIQGAWVAFARTGAPGHGGLPAWPRYSADHRATMVLGRECRLEEAPLEPERRLLERWAGHA
jgi:para-nitrobenzyl esterase